MDNTQLPFNKKRSVRFSLVEVEHLQPFQQVSTAEREKPSLPQNANGLSTVLTSLFKAVQAI